MKLAAALPWLALLALLAATCAPLLLSRDALFIGGLHGDMITTIWFYDLIGRSLPETPSALSTFDWPSPYATTQEFPATVDAALGGVWLRWQGWIDGWGEVQSTILAVNALGAAALAYAAGCRGAGIFIAGGLALLCRQLWFDLVGARLNAAWPGLSMGAIAAALLLLAPQRRLAERLALVAGGALLGALAAHIYPPHLVGFAPLGLLLAVGPARQHPRLLLWAAAPAALALLASAEVLQVIAETREGRDCAQLQCADQLHALSIDALARWRPARGGLTQPGVGITAWILLPTMLLHRRRRTLALCVLLLAPLVWISLGPCPSLSGRYVDGVRTLERWSGLWCALHQLSDYGRAATVAALSAAVLSGLGAEALPRWWAQWATGALVVGASAWMFAEEYRDPDKWRRPFDSPAGIFLSEAAPGPVAELPYDPAGQFLSALTAPERPRVNPLKLQPRGESVGPALRWLHALGEGQPAPSAPPPTAAALSSEVGVRWVLLEPGRCGHHDTTCARDTVPRVSAVLGVPEVLFDGALYVWPVPTP